MRPVLDDPRLFNEIALAYRMRDKGFLPFGGAYMEQPALLMDSFVVVDRVVAEIERINDKTRKAKAKAKGGKP